MTVYIDRPEVNEYLEVAQSEDNVFYVNDFSAFYEWSLTRDSLGFVVWNESHYDVLKGVDTIRFKDVDVTYNATFGFVETTRVLAEGQTYADHIGAKEFVTGTVDLDTYVISASSAGYGWNISNDGKGIVVWKGSEYNVLHDIEQVRFDDVLVVFDGKALTSVPLTDVPGVTLYDQRGVNDFYSGSASAEDRYLVNGSSTDYGWSLAEDGVGVVLWNGAEFNVLHDVEQIVFNDATIYFDGETFSRDADAGPVSRNDVVGENEVLTGTSALDDTFIIAGQSSDYGWSLAEDGVGLVVWNDTEYAVLHDFERIQFDDLVLGFNDGVIGVEGASAPAIEEDRVLTGSVADDIYTGSAGAETFVASLGDDVMANMLFSEGDTLDLSLLLDETVTAENIADVVTLSQDGDDAVFTVNTVEALSTVTLESVDLSAYTSVVELIDSGYVSF